MKIHKILRFTIILLLITAWTFSGFPRIWKNPAIPLEIREAWGILEGLAPDAILAITELSLNDVTYIQDDPDSPDGNWLVASGNGFEPNKKQRRVIYVERIDRQSLKEFGYEGRQTDHAKRVEEIASFFRAKILINDAEL